MHLLDRLHKNDKLDVGKSRIEEPVQIIYGLTHSELSISGTLTNAGPQVDLPGY